MTGPRWRAAWPFVVMAFLAGALALDFAPAFAWLLALGTVLAGVVGISLVLPAGRRSPGAADRGRA
ncbi:hypothetical protein [Cellulomonas fimi]|uniref:Uncharacterized protein n=1 Tax=Cellulomonas fimi TaxID=1708 RepID=A0A7Y0QFC7_CELFI|nr:hypothetical protein [Cellulomonas fimi]NMR18931.1 hypothetical protein [Cellulomonas fimi]